MFEQWLVAATLLPLYFSKDTLDLDQALSECCGLKEMEALWPFLFYITLFSVLPGPFKNFLNFLNISIITLGLYYFSLGQSLRRKRTLQRVVETWQEKFENDQVLLQFSETVSWPRETLAVAHIGDSSVFWGEKERDLLNPQGLGPHNPVWA